MNRKRYIDTAGVARLIRKELKATYPGQKFWVRSDVYSGGSSIDIYWIDGPSQKEVDRLTGKYSGSGFDGMIDLKYAYKHVQNPDGSIVLVGTNGTVGSAGTVPMWEAGEDEFHPDAEPVTLGVDFIFTWHEHSYDRFVSARQALVERYPDLDIPAAQRCKFRVKGKETDIEIGSWEPANLDWAWWRRIQEEHLELLSGPESVSDPDLDLEPTMALETQPRGPEPATEPSSASPIRQTARMAL